MRLPDWDAETIAKYRARWEVVRSESGELAYVGLANLLSTQADNPITSPLLHHLAGSRNRSYLYSEISIPKKTGGDRILLVPKPSLKWVQRSINQVFSHITERKKCVKGFERGESIVTHARCHTHKRWVFTVDIKDFFPSITWGRIYGTLQAYPFYAGANVARILANIVTYNNSLPQGSPCSPLLANMVCRAMDSLLLEWARKNGAFYSRYADDLTFTTNRKEFTESQQKEIEEIIRKAGFSINQEKTRLLARYKRQLVTGLVVNSGRANVPREQYRNLRAFLHNVARFGWATQLHRKSLGDSNLIARYRAGKLTKQQAEDIREKQRVEHCLLSPLVRLGPELTIHRLQQIIRGKIEFIGQVGGRDSHRYVTLRSMYELVCQAGQVERSLLAMTAERRHLNKSYAEFRSVVENAKKSDEVASIELLRSIIREHEGIPELKWLLAASVETSFDKLKAQALEAFYASQLSAARTTDFFRFFLTDDYYRGLLHPPLGSTITTDALLANCERAFLGRREELPNKLKEKISNFLRECKQIASQYPQQHPWELFNFRKNVLFNFKRGTRFEASETDDFETTSFKSSIQKVCSEAKASCEREDVQLTVKVRNFATIYIDVVEIENGLRLILQSIISNCQTGNILVRGLQRAPAATAGTEQLWLDIIDHGAVVNREPKVVEMFNGKLRRALQTLRGHVGWEITANFAEGGYFHIDVMNNKVEPLVDTNHERPGLQHRIVFYIQTA